MVRRPRPTTDDITTTTHDKGGTTLTLHTPHHSTPPHWTVSALAHCASLSQPCCSHQFFHTIGLMDLHIRDIYMGVTDRVVIQPLPLLALQTVSWPRPAATTISVAAG